MENEILQYCAIEHENILYKLDVDEIDFLIGNVIKTEFGLYEILGVINGIGITRIKKQTL
jgi:hypothetical protein